MRLFPLLALAALVLFGLWWFLRTPPEQVARMLRRALIGAGAALLIFLAATGRLHWLFALLGAALPFVQRAMRLLPLLPLLQRLLALLRSRRAAGAPAAGRQSRVDTRYLRMVLDHDTGDMDGEVLEGALRGRRLSELSLEQALGLLQECRQDDQSAAVLEAYLDRRHGDAWRDATGGQAPGSPPASPGAMTRDEAYAILGLAPGAADQEIVEAHRRLMQRLHPDRGGSTWLAARINKAKDLLLGNR